MRLVNELAVVLNLSIFACEHRHVRVNDAGRLLLPALVVTSLASYAVHRSDPAALAVVVGVIIMSSAVVLTGILVAMGAGLAVGIGTGRCLPATAVGRCIVGLALGGGALTVIRGLSTW